MEVDQYLDLATRVAEKGMAMEHSPLQQATIESITELVVKALEVAKLTENYADHIYDASLVFWKLTEPWIRNGALGYLGTGLSAITEALCNTEHPDHTWLAQLLTLLVEAHIENGDLCKASSGAAEALRVALQYEEWECAQRITQLQGRWNLMNDEFWSHIASQPHLVVQLELHQLGRHLSSPRNILKKKSEDGLLGLYKRILSVNSKALATDPDNPKQESNMPEPLSDDIKLSATDRLSLLTELAWLCVDYDNITLATKCSEQMCSITEMNRSQKIEHLFLRCQILLKTNSQTSTQISSEYHLQMAQKCETGLSKALKIGDRRLIEKGVATLWNATLPLMQQGPKSTVRRWLQSALDALDQVHSCLSEVRLGVLLQLAHIEAEQGDLRQAIQHLIVAQDIDHSGKHSAYITQTLYQLRLTVNPYQELDNEEDKATLIMTQVRLQLGNTDPKVIQSTLLSAGQVLARGKFLEMVDYNCTDSKELAADRYKNARLAIEEMGRPMPQADSHYRQSMWLELAELAAMHAAWDVARAAARICKLQYSSTGTCSSPVMSTEPPTATGSAHGALSEQTDNPAGEAEKLPEGELEPISSELLEVDRWMARAGLILAEGLMHLLNICDATKVEEESDVDEKVLAVEEGEGKLVAGKEEKLTTHSQNIAAEVYSSLHSAMVMANRAKMPELVYRVVASMWNFSQRLVVDGQEHKLVSHFLPALEILQGSSCARSCELVTMLTAVAARGLIKPWLTRKAVEQPVSPVTPALGKKGKSAKGKGTEGPVISTEEANDYKQALTLTERAKDVVVASCRQEGVLVSLSVYQNLLDEWVHCKHLTRQSIGKDYGTANMEDKDVAALASFTCALVAHSMLRHRSDAASLITVKEVVLYAEACSWRERDGDVELRLWTDLGRMALLDGERCIAEKCCRLAVAVDHYKRSVKNKAILSEAWFQLGTSLMPDASIKTVERNAVPEAMTKSRPGTRQVANATVPKQPAEASASVGKTSNEALHATVCSAKHGYEAQRPDLVTRAMRLFWNMCRPLVEKSSDRSTLAEQVKLILKYSAKGRRSGQSCADADDASIRAALYAVLLQSHADREQWKLCLHTADEALKSLPRGRHCLPIYRLRILASAMMHLPIDADIKKFVDEGDEQVAALWRMVAMTMSNMEDRVLALHQGVQALAAPASRSRRVELLFEIAAVLRTDRSSRERVTPVLQDIINLLSDLETHVVTTSNATLTAQSRDNPEKDQCTLGVWWLDCQVKVHVLMAEQAGFGTDQHRSESMQAADYATRLVQMVLRSALEDDKLRISSGKSVGSRDSKTGKGRSKIGACTMPNSAEEWAEFNIPTEVLHVLRKDQPGLTSVSVTTVNNPSMSFELIDQLIDSLHTLGLTLLCCPLLVLQQLLGEGLLQSKPLVAYVNLRYLKICEDLGLTDAAERWSHCLHDVGMTIEVALCLQVPGTDVQQVAMIERALIGQADVLYKLHRPAEAVACAEGAQQCGEMLRGRVMLSHATRDLLGRLLLTRALLVLQAGDTHAALRLLQQARRLPSTVSLSRDVMLGIIETLVTAGRTDEAVGFLDEAARDGEAAGSRDRAYYRASLRGLHAGLLAHTAPDRSSELDVVDLNSTTGRLFEESWKELLQLGYVREALGVATKHADFLACVGANSTDKLQLYERHLEARRVLVSAEVEADKLLTTTKRDLGGQSSLCRPVEREVVTVKLDHYELCLDMLELWTKEKLQYDIEQRSKHPTVRLIEEYTWSDEDMPVQQREWQTTCCSLATKVLCSLSKLHDTFDHYPTLHARYLWLLGRCKELASNAAGLHQPLQSQLRAVLSSQPSQTNNDEIHTTDDCQPKVGMHQKPDQHISQTMAAAALTHQLLSEASEHLQLSCKIALQSGCLHTAAGAALGLVELCGHSDPHLAGEYLALYQSCLASDKLREVLSYALKRAPHTLLTSGERLLQHAEVADTWTGESVHSQLLHNYTAWQTLQVSPQHLALMKDLPANFTVVVLQHSLDRSMLYGAVLEKPKHTTGKMVKQPGIHDHPIVCRMQSNPDKLRLLVDQSRMLSDKLDAAEHKRCMFSEKQQQGSATQAEGKRECEEELQNLVASTEMYLQPVLSQISEVFQMVDNSASHQQEALVILADCWLMQLPLECLQVCSGFGAVCRDFSLQILHHRFHHSTKKDERKGSASSDTASKKKADKKTAGGKAASLRPVPAGYVGAPLAGTRYITDPHAESEVTESVLRSVLTQHAALTASWDGYHGSKHQPNLTEWQAMLGGCKSFIYCGLESLTCELQAHVLVHLSLSDCELMVLVDGAHTKESLLRVGKLRPSFDDRLSTAQLLTICGVRSLVTNALPSSTAENCTQIQRVLTEMLENNRSTGQVVQQMYCPLDSAASQPQAENPTSDVAKQQTGRFVCYGLPNVVFC
ncbi:PREDICTED: cilia- and flagella-associated protein 46-like [Priapulus caudatus]|uniref:Cilia- and flagella-associated protein 46-like n=1 Tax=Priapulus caudatus TaxID=37621 RepID=A0ABM1FBA8_PRICU|nr:PREDICTED: cilia- and flagella-associated protein 46-like [Priapulus caudatus]